MNERAKLITVTVLLMSAGGYGYWKYRSLQPSPAINNGVTNEFGGRMRSESERKNFMEQAAAYAELSPDQVKKLDELRKQREQAGGERGQGPGFTSFTEVMTPEQRTKMREYFMSQRDANAKKVMSPGEFETYKAKREQMIARWRGSGGGRGGRGGPGGRGGQGETGGQGGTGTAPRQVRHSEQSAS